MAFAVLVFLVAGVHAWIGVRFLDGDWAPPGPQRMSARYVNTLTLSAPQPLRDHTAAPAKPVRPPAVARAADPRAQPRAVAPQAQAASAVATVAVVPVPPEPPTSPAPVPVDAASSSASAVASAASAPVVGDDGFRWPSAIRLNYQLRGYYRGEIYGGAQVEWLREAQRYQVHLDLWVGARMAPFISRSLSSEGELGERGLVPQRYDQTTQFAFRDPVRLVVLMAPDGVTLSHGQRVERVPDLQDTASQFIQMSWRMNQYPALASPGTLLEIPLAMPRRVQSHLYEVAALERMATPMGELDVLRVIPRTPARGGDLSVETWLAPQLRFLPVRIRLRQDDETYVDLTLASAPEIAESAVSAQPAETKLPLP